MRLPDGTILMHGETPYDPHKAHEYYMRTRKLHPRAKKGSYTITTSSGSTYRVSAQQLQEQKAYAQARVNQIKKNLSDLNVLLREKLREAKDREAKTKKPPTLAEKAKAAREAEAYRKKHKTELRTKAREQAAKNKSSSSGSSKTSTKTDTVDSLKKEIIKTRANLKAAVARQRELAAAKKNG